MRWLVALLLVVGCKKSSEAPPPNPNNAPPIPADELKRGEDACNGLVQKLCTCAETVEAAKAQCETAKSFSEVIKMSTQMTMSQDSSKLDVKQAARDIRKTIAECIQQTSKLPEIGCKL
jgi:hypothetical protein